MNSSTPSARKRATQLVQARRAFNWIELLAIPLASSIMETQPVALFLLLGATSVVGENAVAPLDAVSITLLLLGLQWWEMLIQYFIRRGLSEEWAKFLHQPGLCVAIGLTIVTHLALLQNIPALIVVLGLIIWFWWRGMKLAHITSQETYLITSFKVGFAFLLIVMFSTVLYFSPIYQFDHSYKALHDAVGSGMAIYFLSGVIGLSLTRINLIRKEGAYHAPGSTLADPTRMWLISLTLLWVVITGLALALEVFSFESVLAVMAWLWNALGDFLGLLMNWITPLVNAFLRQMALLFSFPLTSPLHVPPPATSHPRAGQPPPQIPLSVLTLLRLALLLVLLGILLLVIRTILRMWRVVPEDDSEDEVRESLSRAAILKTRREEQQRRSGLPNEQIPLEPLASNSARAYYRELLQALAEQNVGLARRSAETPVEYEVRLLSLIEQTPALDRSPEDLSTDRQILRELTRAYAQERYGGKEGTLLHPTDWHGWMTRFVERLAASVLQDISRR